VEFIACHQHYIIPVINLATSQAKDQD